MEKIWNEMYEAAKAVLNERRISEYITCGEVSAAVCSTSSSIKGVWGGLEPNIKAILGGN